MQLVDVHCHLESDEFTDLDAVIHDAQQAGVVKMLTSSIIPEQWPLSRELAQRFPSVEFACGIHPWYIQPAFETALDGLADACAGAVAVGEIGLDAKTENVPMAVQRRFFERQLEIAKEIHLPVIVHCRGAFDELIHSVRRVGLCPRGGVMHNFSGSAQLAQQLAAYGFSFSLGGTLTYRNSRKKIDLLRAIYPKWFLLETDSPDIPPVEARQRPNVPANIVYNLRAAAEALGESEESISKHTTENAVEVFQLSLQEV